MCSSPWQEGVELSYLQGVFQTKPPCDSTLKTFRDAQHVRDTLWGFMVKFYHDFWQNFTGGHHCLAVSWKAALTVKFQIISWLLGLLHRDALFPVCLLRHGFYVLDHWQLLPHWKIFGHGIVIAHFSWPGSIKYITYPLWLTFIVHGHVCAGNVFCIISDGIDML